MFVSAWSRCISLFAKRLKEIYRSWPYKVALGVFVVSFITLGWLGMEPVTKTGMSDNQERGGCTSS
jgi:quinol-cytochrome oxidoreductase complex cytochrome b subunit